MEHIINPVYYQDFILAGNCEFTLRSLKTGNEVMFLVKKAKYDGSYWVNSRTRRLLGKLLPVEDTTEVYWFQSTTHIADKIMAKEIEVFGYFWMTLLERMIEPHKFKIHVLNPYNRCAHCHRPLTHPESIPIGIGPDCFKKLGLTHKTLIHG